MRACVSAHGVIGMNVAPLRRPLLFRPVRCQIGLRRNRSVCSAAAGAYGQLQAVLDQNWLLQQPDTQVRCCIITRIGAELGYVHYKAP